MRRYFGESGAQIHARIEGAGKPLVFLPPAPHTGAYFDTIVLYLPLHRTFAVDYPGYGGSDRISDPSIETYAKALSPHVPDGAILVGFHTGNLVAAEIARHRRVSGIVMIDVPFFGVDTRRAYAANLPDKTIPSSIEESFTKAVINRTPGTADSRAFELWVESLRSGAHRTDAFHAAFCYDPEEGLLGLRCPIHLIATQSSLLEPTRQAASAMDAPLTERIDITAPVFETCAEETASVIRAIIQGF